MISGRKVVFSKIVLLVMLVASLSSLPAIAQVLYGALVGNVRDASGAAIPDAKVKITQQQTNLTREVTTNDLGAYSFPTVPAGTYSMTVTKEGFQTLENRGVEITTNSVVRVDLGLVLGQLSQKVEVSAAAAVLQSDRAEVRGELGTDSFNNIPIPPGRNFQQLLVTIPGFSPPTRGGSSITNPSKALTYNVNGGQRTSTGMRIDGASAVGNWMAESATYAPSIEAVETVNTVTSSFDAEEGIAGGAAINVTTKSGTNNVHGSLFEYHNDNALNARPYFLPADQRKPKRILNEFGATVGGPIKKDRLFYFVSYEATYERKLASGFATVPSAAVRTGNMSASPTPIYNPNTGDSTGAGRVPFAGNIIPQNLISPIVQKILPLIPQPLWTDRTSSNYYTSGVSKYTRHRVDSKFNWNPINRLNLSARVSYLPLRTYTPAVFGTTLVGTALSTGVFDDIGPGISNFWNSQLNASYTVTPRFIIDATYGYTLEDYKLTMDGFNWDKKTGLDVLGIPGTNGPGQFDGGFPGFAVDNYTKYGGDGGGGRLLDVRDPQRTYSVNASWIKGAHSIRFGVDLLFQQMNHWEPLGVYNTFSFAGGPTTLRGGPASNLYNSFSTFLLGLPTTIAKTTQTEQKTSRAATEGFYVRDQWQASRKLTLSYGLRMEYYPVATRANRGMEIYDLNTNQMLLCGNGSVPKDCGISVKMYYSPRIGIAYRMTKSLVARAGYSISYDPYSMARPLLSNYPEQVSQSTPAPNSFVPAGLLSNGIPTLPTPDLTASKIDVPVGVGVTTAPQKYDRGYIQSWNLTLQKELKWGFVGQAGYIGNSGIRLRAASNINFGTVDGGTASEPLFAKFGRTASTNVIQPLGYSRYHSLQTQLDRRFANGIQIKMSYTFSKAIMMCCGDGYDPSPAIKIPQYFNLNRALAPNDRPHAFTLAAIQELPFGKGKAMLSHSGFLSSVVSGWQISELVTRFSGNPMSISASATSLNAPNNSQRADQVKPEVAILGGHGTGQSYFDPLAFASVTAARFGTAGFNTVRGPGLFNLDVALFRQFAFGERWKAQIRAEAYNIPNTPNFANPGTNVSSMTLNSDGTVKSLGGYTEITSMNSTSREGLAERVLQFGVRITF